MVRMIIYRIKIHLKFKVNSKLKKFKEVKGKMTQKDHIIQKLAFTRDLKEVTEN